jgi:hypothetical protein
VDEPFQLAQVNIARGVGPTDSPEMAEFMTALDPINALAEASPGFVWRLQDEDGNATAIRPYEDDTIMINLSVWESIDDLFAFVYKTRHVDYFRRRREWFERFPSTHLALWWVPAGTIPTPIEAKERIDHLEANGPTPYAFTLKKRFEPEAQPAPA